MSLYESHKSFILSGPHLISVYDYDCHGDKNCVCFAPYHISMVEIEIVSGPPLECVKSCEKIFLVGPLST